MVFRRNIQPSVEGWLDKRISHFFTSSDNSLEINFLFCPLLCNEISFIIHPKSWNSSFGINSLDIVLRKRRIILLVIEYFFRRGGRILCLKKFNKLFVIFPLTPYTKQSRKGKNKLFVLYLLSYLCWWLNNFSRGQQTFYAIHFLGCRFSFSGKFSRIINFLGRQTFHAVSTINFSYLKHNRLPRIIKFSGARTLHDKFSG